MNNRINRKHLTLAGIYLGLIGSVMVSGSTSTVLPTIAADLGGIEYYSLASTAAAPVSVCAMILYGYLGLHNPAAKRKLYVFSMTMGSLAIFLRGVARNFLCVLFPGALWGLVSAGIYVMGFSMIRQLFDAKAAGFYLGVCGTMSSIGKLAGPFLTGLVIDLLGWRAACHMMWPLIALSGLLVWLGIREPTVRDISVHTGPGGFDFSGAAALMIFLTAFILFLSLGPGLVPFGSPLSWSLLGICAAALLAFIPIARKKGADAVIPVTVLKNRNALCLMLGNLFFNFSNMAIFFFLPTFILKVMNGTATQASLVASLSSIAGLILSPFFGRRIARTGNARGTIVCAGLQRILIAAALLFTLSPNVSAVFLCFLMLLSGIYNCQQAVVSSTAPQIQIPEDLRISGNAVIQTAQNVGSAVGTAVYSSVIGFLGIAQGMKASLLLSIIAAGLGVLSCLFLKKADTSV